MRAIAILAFAGVCAIATDAQAAGLYFSERGVRPLGRGGAFTAGADDLGSIWYNPAGVYDSGQQILFDASWLHFTADYQRRALLEQVDPNNGEVVGRYEQVFEPVEGTSPVIPIPTLAGSFRLHDRVVVALGVEAPYSAITSYPETIDGKPGPQRYSLVTLEGSALAIVGAWAGFKPHDDWRLGLGFQMLVGRFAATSVFGACVPDKFFCAPEQPEWDALSQISVGPIVAPSGNLGAQYRAHRSVRLGTAFQLPFFVRAPGEVRTRLPATPAFETAFQEGEDATVSFELPWSLRAGVEARPLHWIEADIADRDALRVELDGSIEGWSMHDSIDISPENVALRNVVGFPDPYRVPEQSIPRNFEDTFSVRLGAEYLFPVDREEDIDLEVRAGASYESSAIPDEYLSVLTIDIDKITLGLGGSLHYGAFRFDVVYAHVFGSDVEVDSDEAAAPLLQPVDANLPEPHTVNGGSYSARANVIGLGLRYDLDAPTLPAK